ncbi:hypothetical protein ERO13_D11G031200v2 [Gossypium hirsutum]|uniref:Uncharacterized protein n=4 Tax=Gossypium TaxID=3633 RepID=A0A5J5P6C3_GOSBA|nr:hypothetical protein ES319_D11G032700v1 [Gossypium barbadense]KAG4118675.1 hypothetical protein ERO13_D11G031200v2 [Gossypium hirsutum]TYG43647.1 hypothetical protein ES288_D11G034400v1 [Gossypium darwinii]TYH42013.1 hypothetical protein ES332_D11G033900v1 [Gossypium tomentosum]TYI53825.1 hypothetical protein E1A91_D11G032800v1 [Gossypium mustelinum]
MIEERNERSLCEKSMKMVANIIRLSSFSIAKMSLGEPTTATTKSPVPTTGSDTFTDEPSRFSGSHKQTRSKPYSFMMEPAASDGNESRMVREEKEHSDGRFAEYIRKVHEKNRRNSHEASKHSSYILPPPPTPLRRRK